MVLMKLKVNSSMKFLHDLLLRNVLRSARHHRFKWKPRLMRTWKIKHCQQLESKISVFIIFLLSCQHIHCIILLCIIVQWCSSSSSSSGSSSSRRSATNLQSVQSVPHLQPPVEGIGSSSPMTRQGAQWVRVRVGGWLSGKKKIPICFEKDFLKPIFITRL